MAVSELPLELATLMDLGELPHLPANLVDPAPLSTTLDFPIGQVPLLALSQLVSVKLVGEKSMDQAQGFVYQLEFGTPQSTTSALVLTALFGRPEAPPLP